VAVYKQPIAIMGLRGQADIDANIKVVAVGFPRRAHWFGAWHHITARNWPSDAPEAPHVGAVDQFYTTCTVKLVSALASVTGRLAHSGLR
jgi:hypothetical protein